MSPLERYQELLLQPGFSRDPAQQAVTELLDALYHELLKRSLTRDRSHFLRLMERLLPRSRAPLKGLYLWGGVGRGKTMLMDLFYDCLTESQRLRMHFHRFMQRVHHELKDLAGTPDPLQVVADRLEREGNILCFDEFFVSDIGDAMILGELMQALFERGVTLVATSNVEPNKLYENGLQRSRFLPVIELIETHTQVFEVCGDTDHRLRVLERAEIYHAPLDGDAENSLARSFAALAPEKAEYDVTLEIEGRPIVARCVSDDVVWFDFSAICEGPRSQNDYIELSRIYHAVLLSNVPRFTPRNEDGARRFISLVDEFYDHNVKLIISAETTPTELYSGGHLRFEFHRTESRLLEMQSHEYLARTHRA